MDADTGVATESIMMAGLATESAGVMGKSKETVGMGAETMVVSDMEMVGVMGKLKETAGLEVETVVGTESGVATKVGVDSRSMVDVSGNISRAAGAEASVGCMIVTDGGDAGADMQSTVAGTDTGGNAWGDLRDEMPKSRGQRQKQGLNSMGTDLQKADTTLNGNDPPKSRPGPLALLSLDTPSLNPPCYTRDNAAVVVGV